MLETPQISNSCYANQVYVPGFSGAANLSPSLTMTATAGEYCVGGNIDDMHPLSMLEEAKRASGLIRAKSEAIQKRKKEGKLPMSTHRLVRVFIADIDENLPLDKALLHRGDEQLTDLTDQELFFEIDIKPLLATHNQYRTTVLDKKASIKMGKDIFLEPVKIRDLKMTIVNIAEF